MCSRIVDEMTDSAVASDEIQMQLKKRLVLKDDNCKKCGVNKASVVLREQDVYCSSCLLASVTHKFRASLGKSKLMKTGEKVLISYSGGQASTAMLKLTEEGLAETTHKKLRFSPSVIYVDEGALINASIKDRIDTLKQISSIARKYSFQAYLSSIEMVMAPNDVDQFMEIPDESEFEKLSFFNNEEISNKLRNLFSSVTSLSSKEDLLLKLRHQLLARIATKLGCSKILLGDTETLIAVRVLADIALGKGGELAQNCGFADGRHEHILLIRPLRELLMKEIAYFVNVHKLQTVFNPTLATKRADGDSIQQRTESFIYGLEEDFPATVSTIFRTGDKMRSALPKNTLKKENSEISSSKTKCILCSGSVDTIDFSSKTDSTGVTGACSKCTCTSQNSCLTMEEVIGLCCHSCSLIFKEMSEIKHIPPQILDKAALILRREKMRSEIVDFLLDS